MLVSPEASSLSTAASKHERQSLSAISSEAVRLKLTIATRCTPSVSCRTIDLARALSSTSVERIDHERSRTSVRSNLVSHGGAPGGRGGGGGSSGGASTQRSPQSLLSVE